MRDLRFQSCNIASLYLLPLSMSILPLFDHIVNIVFVMENAIEIFGNYFLVEIDYITLRYM